MAPAAKRSRNAPHIGTVFSGSHAEVATVVPVVPDQAKRMIRREALSDLTREDGALYGRDDGALKLYHHGLSGQLPDELLFVSKNRATFLFQFWLAELIPSLEVEWIGCNGGVDLSTARQLPIPEVLVLDVLQQPGSRSAVGSFPSQDRA